MMGDGHLGEDVTGPSKTLRLEASGFQNYTLVTAHSLLCHPYLPATALAVLSLLARTLARSDSWREASVSSVGDGWVL